MPLRLVLHALESRLALPADPPRRLAAALAGGDTAARAVAGCLRLSNALRDRIVAALGQPEPAADLPFAIDHERPVRVRALVHRDLKRPGFAFGLLI